MFKEQKVIFIIFRQKVLKKLVREALALLFHLGCNLFAFQTKIRKWLSFIFAEFG